MKYPFLLCFLFASTALCAQQAPDTRPKIKTLLEESSKGGSYYAEFGPDGTRLFTKLDGLNHNPVMLYAAEFDSLQRERISWSAHANLGFYIDESVYEKDRVLHYKYRSDSILRKAFDGSALHDINSKEAFLQMEGLKALAQQPKYLGRIELLDSAGHVTAEIQHSEKGDTTSIDTYDYNEKGLQVAFHYNVGHTDLWAWDIYQQYDDQGQRVLSYRIPRASGGQDTTEVYTYRYNSFHQLESESHYDRKNFINRTDYVYENKRLKAEYFYERKEHEPDVITTYTYNAEGYIAQETQRDFREPKKRRKEVIRYHYTYW